MTSAINKAKRLSGINTLAYLGIEPSTAPLLIVNTSAPTSLDRAQNQIGALWIVPPTGNPVVPATSQIWVLTSIVGAPPGGATWIQLEQSGGGTAIEQIVTDNGIVIPVAHIINENGGTSVGGVATNINTYANPDGSNNLVVALNNSISQPNTNNTGTAGLYSLGGAGAAFRFMHNYGTGNTFLGNTAGNLTLTTASATGNTGIGANALQSLTTGVDNCSLGEGGGFLINSGSNNISIGSLSNASLTSENNCIAIGTNALTLLTPHLSTGESSIGIGYNALTAATSQVRMIAIGDSAMSVGPGGDNSIAIGFQAAQNMGLSTSCIFLGYQAGRNNNQGGGVNAGIRNIAIGTSAMSTGITTGNENIMIGYQAGNDITSGADNWGGGARSLLMLTSGSNNCALGNDSLAHETTGSDTVALGTNCLLLQNGGSQNVCAGSNVSAATTTASGNVILGYNAMTTATGNPSSNVVIGWNALGAAPNMSSTVVIGYNAGNSATCNSNNDVIIGFRAYQSSNLPAGFTGNTSVGASSSLTMSGTHNTALGYASMAAATSLINSIALGYQALSQGTLTGSYNIGIGYNVGSAYAGAESSNILIANDGVAAESNTIRIGTQGAGVNQQNTTYIAGIFGSTVDAGSGTAVFIDNTGLLGTMVSSERYKDNIQVMDDISEDIYNLEPVTFTYKSDPKHHTHYGLIAEHVEHVMPSLVVVDAEGRPESVKYHDLPVLLLNELKKLRERVDELENEVQLLKD